MRYFKVPFNIDEEDKVIGGYISLRQFFWLALPLTVFLILFVVFRGYLILTYVNGDKKLTVSGIGIIIRLIITLIFAVIGALMAFYKVDNNMFFDKYCSKLIKYKLRKHLYKFTK